MVESKRVGFGKNSQFYWCLPDNEDLVRHLKKRDFDELADALFRQEPETPPEKPDSDFLGYFEKLEESVDEEDPADWWKRGKNTDEELDDEGEP